MSVLFLQEILGHLGAAVFPLHQDKWQKPENQCLGLGLLFILPEFEVGHFLSPSYAEDVSFVLGYMFFLLFLFS